MSDKCSFRDSTNCAQKATSAREHDIAPPRSAYELIVEKKRLHPERTVWFNGDTCPKCGKYIYTDGATKWCSPECKTPGAYAKLQEDYMR